MKVQQRISAERATVMALVRELFAAGYTVGYHDGEDLTVPVGTDAAAIREELHSTDDARLIVRRPDDTSFRAGVYMVFGNSPGEVFCDWTDVEPMSSMIMRVADAADERYNG